MSHHIWSDAVDHVINEHLDDSLSGLCIEIDHNTNFNMTDTLLALPFFDFEQKHLMYQYQQPNEQTINIVLSAPTSPAMKVDEDSLTYLNQGQPYELKFQYIGNDKNAKFFKSYVKITFHDRRLQYCEDKQITLWQMDHPTERILEVDTPLSRGIIEAKNLPYKVNMIEISWDPFKTASVYLKINCISTEFTPKKHGGEKGVPFRLQVDTYSLEEGNFQRIFTAFCQVKIFKPKGADRKHKTDREKMEKQFVNEKHKYQLSCPFTVLMPTTPDNEFSSFQMIQETFSSSPKPEPLGATNTPPSMSATETNNGEGGKLYRDIMPPPPPPLNCSSFVAIADIRNSFISSAATAVDNNKPHNLERPPAVVATSTTYLHIPPPAPTVLNMNNTIKKMNNTSIIKKDVPPGGNKKLLYFDDDIKVLPEKRRDISDDLSHNEEEDGDHEDPMMRRRAKPTTTLNKVITTKKRTGEGHLSASKLGGQLDSSSSSFVNPIRPIKEEEVLVTAAPIGSTINKGTFNDANATTRHIFTPTTTVHNFSANNTIPTMLLSPASYYYYPPPNQHDTMMNNCSSPADSASAADISDIINLISYDDNLRFSSHTTNNNNITKYQQHHDSNADILDIDDTTSSSRPFLNASSSSTINNFGLQKNQFNRQNGGSFEEEDDSTSPKTDESTKYYHKEQPPGSNATITVIEDTISPWLEANNFGTGIARLFGNFTALDMRRLSRKDLIEICGVPEGIRLNNALQCVPPRARLTLFLAPITSLFKHEIGTTITNSSFLQTIRDNTFKGFSSPMRLDCNPWNNLPDLRFINTDGIVFTNLLLYEMTFFELVGKLIDNFKDYIDSIIDPSDILFDKSIPPFASAAKQPFVYLVKTIGDSQQVEDVVDEINDQSGINQRAHSSSPRLLSSSSNTYRTIKPNFETSFDQTTFNNNKLWRSKRFVTVNLDDSVLQNIPDMSMFAISVSYSPTIRPELTENHSNNKQLLERKKIDKPIIIIHLYELG